MHTIPKRRPETTLFLTSSVDGKLTGHDADMIDPNPAWKQTPGIRAVLQRFYDFSDPKTSVVTSGEAMKQTGVNEKVNTPTRLKMSLVVFDHTSSVTARGVAYLAQCVHTLYFIGTPSRLAKLSKKPKNVRTIAMLPKKPLRLIAEQLYEKGVRAMTIHSDGPMNAKWIAEDLVDSMTIVVAPLIVGGNGTSTVTSNLPFDVRALRLVETRAIDESYLFLRYTVVHV